MDGVECALTTPWLSAPAVTVGTSAGALHTWFFSRQCSIILFGSSDLQFSRKVREHICLPNITDSHKEAATHGEKAPGSSEAVRQ